VPSHSACAGFLGSASGFYPAELKSMNRSLQAWHRP